MDKKQKQALQQQAAAQPVQKNDDTMDDKLLDLQKVKNEIREALSGYRLHKIYNEEQQEYELKKVKINERNLCNENAVEDFMATIDGVVNLNIAGSYLNSKDITAMGRKAMYGIIDKIRVNHDKYDIEDPATANQIISIIHANLKGAIKKAAGGRILKHGEETRATRRIETVDETKDEGLLT